MNDFVERHAEFVGFSDYFRKNILDELTESEEGRRKAVKKAQIYFAMCVVLGALLGGFLFLQTQILLLFLVGGLGGFITGWGVAAHALSPTKKQTKTHLVTHISQYLGWTFSEKVEEPVALVRSLFQNKLIQGRYDRVSYEDQIKGEAHGAAFEMTEAHFERESKDDKNRSNWVTVFRGQIMKIDFHREFLGRTVVLRERKFFQSKAFAGMKRVGLVDPVFEKIFEAYGTDQVEARYLLTPTFMQRLVDLETVVNGKNIQFGFVDGLLLIVVETANRFEAGSMFKPLTDPKRTQKILDEFGAVLDVIDGVLKPTA